MRRQLLEVKSEKESFVNRPTLTLAMLNRGGDEIKQTYQPLDS